jgi:uncharacterized membrane protein
MMGYYGYGWNGWMIAMMMAWPLLITVAVWAVVALTRDRGKSGPREILDQRLARGEVTPEQYQQTLDLLTK